MNVKILRVALLCLIATLCVYIPYAVPALAAVTDGAGAGVNRADGEHGQRSQATGDTIGQAVEENITGDVSDTSVTEHIRALVSAGLYHKAIEAYTEHKRIIGEPTEIADELAKAYFEMADYTHAQYLYEIAFTANGANSEALKGIIFSSARIQDYATADRYLEAAYKRGEIPKHVLSNLKFYLLHQMGTSALALEHAEEEGIKDRSRLDPLKEHAAANRITWDEHDVALKVLEEELKQQPDNVGFRSQYIVALGRKYRMQDVLDQYRIIAKKGSSPYEATDAVANALTYLKRPREAEGYYRKMLEQNPVAPAKAYLGLFATYTLLREWKKADAVWARIEDLMKRDKLNWMEKHEALTSRGWFFIRQDKLKEAEDHFEKCLREAGLDPGFRSGLAHVYYHRGWPRMALEQFEIAENIKPDDPAIKVGRAQALNEMQYYRDAREIASQLYRTYPYDLHVVDFYETLKTHDKTLFAGDARFINEAPGATEYRFQLIATETLTPSFKVFADVLHMQNYERTDGEGFSNSWDRFGLGFSWLVVPGITFTQAGSWDYTGSTDFGSTTKLAWQANDNFRAEGAFESFSLDIPLRARAAGIRGKTAFVDLSYNESDLRRYGMMLMSNWFSDGNFNPSVVLRYDQRVLSGPGWKFQISPEFYYARYWKHSPDLVYFSPMYEYSLIVKPLLEICHRDFYDERFASYIYADVGMYEEYGFRAYPVGGFSYGQEIKTSKSFSVKWTAGYGARVYDGRYTNVFQALLSLNWYH